MKKGIAILLLCCFASYHFGYYVFYFSFRMQMESSWSERIFSQDQEGIEHYLMEIPLSIPYMANQEDFQATNTSFEKAGQHYRVIKQRYTNDTLQVIYVSDTAKRTLDNTIKQWISSLIADDGTENGQNTLFAKNFVKDYTQPIHTYSLGIPPFFEKMPIGFIFLPYQDYSFKLNTPPPELG
ncbi:MULTISPECIES: hypothetical protein [Rhodonellum]|nr:MULTISPECIES: hypothetical protein [Rhodonellum]SDY51784.1 hypothetical protein SAMN05444412_101398 [Rhodonellum ikkaensis]